MRSVSLTAHLTGLHYLTRFCQEKDACCMGLERLKNCYTIQEALEKAPLSDLSWFIAITGTYPVDEEARIYTAFYNRRGRLDVNDPAQEALYTSFRQELREFYTSVIKERFNV